MKKLICLVLAVMLLLTVVAIAEDIDVTTYDSENVEAIISTSGAPTFDGIKALYEEAGANNDGDKFMECASACEVMSIALLTPMVSVYNMGENASNYTYHAINYDNDPIWAIVFDKDNRSIYTLYQEYKYAVGICELQAGKCYYEAGENAKALLAMIDGFSRISAGKYESDDEKVKVLTSGVGSAIGMRSLYKEFIPLYGSIPKSV